MKFQKGQRVRLKSGGPMMTVVEVHKFQVVTTWTRDNYPHWVTYNSFRKEQVQLIERKGPHEDCR